MIKKKTLLLSLMILIFAAVPAQAQGSKNWYGCLKMPEISESMILRLTDEAGIEREVEGKLKRIDETESEVTYPFSVECRFLGDRDSQYYYLNDRRITLEGDEPDFSGYKKIILDYLELSPEYFEIEEGHWTGPYIEENGQTVRYAEFTGAVKNLKDYTAYYEAEDNLLITREQDRNSALESAEGTRHNAGQEKDEVDEKKSKQDKAPEENISEIVKSSGEGRTLRQGTAYVYLAILPIVVIFLVAAIFVNLRRKRLNRG
ncbi:MAG: hypothetical protein KH297_04500 [Firmicutes bacterium]|nr:hypothetical protein [Bacillota bacterium]